MSSHNHDYLSSSSPFLLLVVVVCKRTDVFRDYYDAPSIEETNPKKSVVCSTPRLSSREDQKRLHSG